MREVAFEEFTNKHDDTVRIQLSEDSAGGFHLIAKCKKVRREDSHRVVNGRLTEIPIATFTEETTHAQLPDERTAMVEFKLICMLNNMPGFGSDEFQDWLRSTEKEEA